MNLFFVFFSFIVIVLTGCGGGGGGSSTPVPNNQNPNSASASGSMQKRFQEDLAWLRSSQQLSAQSVDSQMSGAFSKAFGSTNSNSVYNFVRERVKYVYTYNEILNFNVTVRNGGQSMTGPLKQFIGEDDNKQTNGSVNMAGANIGAGLAHAEFDSGYEISIDLPVGKKEAGSFRLGLIALTKYYSIIPTSSGEELSVPAESRISVLVHEGRHSDCPEGFESINCGFTHRNCSSGPAAGLPACDNSLWGPYALGALYLKGTLNNYPRNSLNYRIIQSMIDDSFSRLDSQQMDALTNTEPLLNSF
jgi:hypothetical protein